MTHIQLRGQFRVLHDDDNLRQFIVEARTTGRTLGIGSYGAVEEVEINGMVCAGKKIHDTLLDIGNVGAENIATKYVQECQLMSNLRHPNITQFLGVCFFPTCLLPVLVTEKLDGSLDDLLETVPNIPLGLKYSMLEDVARGLLYLHKHNPQVIHRDLTARNILLTSSLVAKITDLGNSRIVNMLPGQLSRTMTRLPGTLTYMPPEALTNDAQYGPSLDIFSFGHLGIYIGLQIFPGDLLEPTYTDPDDINNRRLLGRTEVERRGHYIEELNHQLPRGGQHPFVLLMKRCLHNEPTDRPVADELVSTLEVMKIDAEGSYGEVTRADAVRQVVTMRAFKEREKESREKEDSLSRKNVEIQQLQQENERLQQELEHVQADRDYAEQNVQEKQSRIEHQVAELTRIQEDYHRLSAELGAREAQLRAQNEEIQQRCAEVSRLTKELQSCQAQLCVLQESHSAPLILTDLILPLTLQWRQGNDMPFGTSSPSLVIIDNHLYVGGGRAISAKHEQMIMVYNFHSQQWNELSHYECTSFGMAELKNQLVVVGGIAASTNKRVNILGLWDKDKELWTHPFPPMVIARSSPSVIARHHFLVVAGGYSLAHGYLFNVEVLDTTTNQWYTATSLPLGYSRASSAVIGNTWYLMGGNCDRDHTGREVFGVCLDNLISVAILHTQFRSPLWETLPNTPLVQCSALSVKGALLAIGGRQESRSLKTESAIYLFQPGKQQWTVVGSIPIQRSNCRCTVLFSGEMLVVGGLMNAQRLDIATLIT